MLAFKHIWLGEITPVFSFLTDASNLIDMVGMLQEMTTIGTGMAVLVICAWMNGFCYKQDSKKSD